MLSTPHAVVGAAIGAATGDPIFAAVMGIASHFVLDLVPHFDNGSLRKTNWQNGYDRDWELGLWDHFAAGIDLAVAVIAVYFIWQVNFQPAVWWGAAGALAPDWLDHLPIWKTWFRSTKIGQFYHRFHNSVHFVVPASGWWLGIATQLVIILGGVIWLYG